MANIKPFVSEKSPSEYQSLIQKYENPPRSLQLFSVTPSQYSPQSFGRYYETNIKPTMIQAQNIISRQPRRIPRT